MIVSGCWRLSDSTQLYGREYGPPKDKNKFYSIRHVRWKGRKPNSNICNFISLFKAMQVYMIILKCVQPTIHTQASTSHNKHKIVGLLLPRTREYIREMKFYKQKRKHRAFIHWLIKEPLRDKQITFSCACIYMTK